MGRVSSCSHAQKKHQAQLSPNLGHQTRKILLELHNKDPISTFQRCPSSETDPYPSTEAEWEGNIVFLLCCTELSGALHAGSQPSAVLELRFCLELSESRSWFWETYVLHELWKSPWVKHSGVFWTQKLGMEVTWKFWTLWGNMYKACLTNNSLWTKAKCSSVSVMISSQFGLLILMSTEVPSDFKGRTCFSNFYHNSLPYFIAIMLLQVWWSKDVSTAEFEVTACIKNLTTTKTANITWKSTNVFQVQMFFQEQSKQKSSSSVTEVKLKTIIPSLCLYRI